MISVDDLAHAIVVVGSEYCAIGDVSADTLTRLAEMGLASQVDGEWQLTPASAKLLPRAMEGEPLELPNAVAPPHFDSSGSSVAR